VGIILTDSPRLNTGKSAGRTRFANCPVLKTLVPQGQVGPFRVGMAGLGWSQ
jgi:hypothetical protein